MSDRLPGADVPAIPLLEARALKKVYLRGRWRTTTKTALEDVELTLFRGSTVAIIGKSGSGKSTLARCLALIETPTAGEIRFRDLIVGELSRGELNQVRPCVQLVWQQSALALNPHFRVVDLISEPLRIQGIGSTTERRERALAIMSKLALPEVLAKRLPSQLSGGQRQRVAIARALVQNPAIIIFDEALAGLDVTLQAQIANMLIELKKSFSLSYVFISHDIRMATSLADTIAVMDDGRIVESQAVRDLLASPHNSATRELLKSIPATPIGLRPLPRSR